MSLNFRSHSEMGETYQVRHEQGLGGREVVIEGEKDGKKLVFFGSVHSNEVDHPQMPVIESKWAEFIAHENAGKVAFEEGGPWPVYATREEAILQAGEAGLLVWLANRDGIEMRNAEPNRTAEVDQLLAQGFSVAEIITYYFGRQMLQYVDRDHKTQPDWELYARDSLSRYQGIHDWQGIELTLGEAITMYEASTGKAFAIDDRPSLYEVSDPGTNAVSSASSQFRDQSIYNSIREAWGDGSDVFAVFGSGHAIVMEPALKELIGER